MIKNPYAKAGAAEDLGSIAGLGRSPGEGKGNHSSVLAWRTPWTEGPGGLQCMGFQRVRHNLATKQQEQPVHVGMKISV